MHGLGTSRRSCTRVAASSLSAPSAIASHRPTPIHHADARARTCHGVWLPHDDTLPLWRMLPPPASPAPSCPQAANTRRQAAAARLVCLTCTQLPAPAPSGTRILLTLPSGSRTSRPAPAPSPAGTSTSAHSAPPPAQLRGRCCPCSFSGRCCQARPGSGHGALLPGQARSASVSSSVRAAASPLHRAPCAAAAVADERRDRAVCTSLLTAASAGECRALDAVGGRALAAAATPLVLTVAADGGGESRLGEGAAG